MDVSGSFIIYSVRTGTKDRLLIIKVQIFNFYEIPFVVRAKGPDFPLTSCVTKHVLEVSY